MAVVAATLLLVGGGGDPSGGEAVRTPTPRPPVLRQLWSYAGDPSWPPKVEDGTVYLADGDGVVHAVDAATGDRRWQSDRAWGAGHSMVVAGDVMYVSGYTDSSRDGDSSWVFALDVDSGRRLWEYEPRQMLTGPALSGKQLYFYGRRGGGYASTVYALNTGTGKRAWSHATDIVWALTAADDVVYYVANGRKEKSPQLHALNAETGERLWKAPFAEDVYKRPESLTVADGVLYAIGADGTLSARRPGRGDLLWSHPAELRDFSDSETPVLSGGVVYYGGNDDTQGSKGQVLAVDAATGKRLWSYDTSPLSSPPAVASGTVYVSTEAGELHLLNARDGGFQGRAELADDSDPTATVSDGKVYFGAGDGRLRAAAVTR
ncbi:PQQ-binding-like beta-propeller repeat protein [Spirillospora sp. CA-108201]